MAYLFSYKDIPVYSYDVELLGDRQWLNDTCISIAYRVFEEQLQIEDDDEYEGMATSLKVADYKWIVMPINDNQSFDSASSHWSVLLCHQPTFSFFYLDSHNKYNLSSAKSILPKISRLLQRSEKTKIQIVQCPQQDNSYDCGVYTILFSLAFSQFVASQSNEDLVVDWNTWQQQLSAHLFTSISPHSCNEMRMKLKEFINTQSIK